jgi:hypothetical protein
MPLFLPWIAVLLLFVTETVMANVHHLCLFLPWIAVLLLFILPANRNPAAWWVLAPLGTVAAIACAVPAELAGQLSEVTDLFSLSFTSLAFGLASVWLTAPYLGRFPRVAVFFLALVILEVGSAVAYALRADWESFGVELLAFLMFLACSALVTTLAMTLAALLCRRRYTPFRLAFWTAVFLAAVWLLIAAPFLGLAAVDAGAEALTETAPYVLLLALVTFIVVLPFLLLAFLQPHYRERLFALWHLPRPGPAPSPEPVAPSAA